MQPKPLFLISTLAVFLAMACASPTQLLSGGKVTPLATRTPLPTFTATAEAVVSISIPPTPTETPIPPPPTDTPPPPPTEPPAPAVTEVPPTEPPPTEAPPPPAEEPVAPPAPAEAPTEAPPAPAEASGPTVGANGVIGEISFRDGRNTYAVGERVFVKIKASLPGGSGQKPFGVLGLTTDTGAFQSSWTNATIEGVFTHEDGIALPTPGNHKIWLSICFSSIEACQGGGEATWERFEPGLDVIIQ